MQRYVSSEVICSRLILSLQDTIQFWPLAASMLGMSFRDPLVVMRVMVQVRPQAIPNSTIGTAHETCQMVQLLHCCTLSFDAVS